MSERIKCDRCFVRTAACERVMRSGGYYLRLVDSIPRDGELVALCAEHSNDAFARGIRQQSAEQWRRDMESPRQKLVIGGRVFERTDGGGLSTPRAQLTQAEAMRLAAWIGVS